MTDLDLATPEGQFWHRLTYKPREWVWEHAFRLAASMPPVPADLDKEMMLITEHARNPSRPGRVLDDAAEWRDWAKQVLFEQRDSKDGKEYVGFLVETLMPYFPRFFSTPEIAMAMESHMNHKALPLMTRLLPRFRGLVPVKAKIIITRTSDTESAMSVVPVDDLTGEPIPDFT